MALPDLRPEIAEAVGLFVVVLAGGGAILAGANDLAVALAFTFAIAVMVYALGHVSGAHFNPAISVAFAWTGHFPWRRVPAYISAQVVGATAAALVLRFLFGPPEAVATAISPRLGLAEAFLVEVLAAATLAFVIVAVATDKRAPTAFAGLAIGLAVGLGSIWAGPLTGASMNPARSFGPALAAGAWADLWLYLVAPTAGAALAMLGYERLRGGQVPRVDGREPKL